MQENILNQPWDKDELQEAYDLAPEYWNRQMTDETIAELTEWYSNDAYNA